MKRIGVHGVPRSGTTWVGNIFNSNPNIIYRHQPLYSYEFKDFLTNESKNEDILRFFDKISKSFDYYTNQWELVNKGLVPNFSKTPTTSNAIVYKEARYHNLLETLLREDDEFKLVGIIRNPMATLLSWKNAGNEFKSNWDFNDEWYNADSKNQGLVENFYGYQKWKEVAELFENLKMEYWDRVHLINYSEFIKNPLRNTKIMFKELGIKIDPQTIRFLKESHSETKGTYSVYRKKQFDNDWVGNISEAIVNHIKDDLDNTNLEKYLDI